jgi:hypothetical protein
MNLQGLKEKLNQINKNGNGEDPKALIVDFLNSTTISLEEFVDLITASKIEDDFSKSEIILAFLSKTTITKNQLVDLLTELRIENDLCKSKIIVAFLKKTKVSETVLFELLKGLNIENYSFKSDIVLAFLDKTAITPNGLVDLFAVLKIESNNSQINLIKNFLRANNTRVSVKYFIDLYTGLKMETDFSKKSLISIYLIGNDSTTILDELVELLKELDNNYIKRDIIVDFLSRTKVSQNRLVELLEELSMKSDLLKSEIIVAFLSKTAITLEGFNDLYTKFKLEDDSCKRNIIVAFLSKTAVTKDQLVDLLTQIEIKDDSSKSSIIVAFLSKTAITLEGFIDLLTKFKLEDDSCKIDIIVAFLSKTAITLEDFNDLLTKIELKNDSSKSSIIVAFLIKQKNTECSALFTKILEINEFLNFKYRVDLIIDICKRIDNYDAKQLAELARSLYPSNELMQVELLSEAVDQGEIINDINIFSLGLENIESNVFLLEFLNYAFEKSVLNNNLEVLKLVEGRTHAKYEFLKEVMGTKLIAECLTEESLTILKGLFSGFNLIENNVSMLSLFSYFDVMDQISDFSSMLQPEIKTLLKENFYPSNKILCVKKEEITKLKMLTGVEGNEIENQFLSVGVLCDYFLNKINIPPLTDAAISTYELDFDGVDLGGNDFEVKLVESISVNDGLVESISVEGGIVLLNSMLKAFDDESIKDALESLLKDKFYADTDNKNKEFPLDIVKQGVKEHLNDTIKKLKKDRADIFVFSEILPAIKKELAILYPKKEGRNKQKELNVTFKKILSSTELNVDQISIFFSEVFMLDLSNVTNGKQKLADFCNKNKNELAHFFKIGGLKYFAVFLSTLKDGCSSNLGNQFTMGLYSSMLKDNSSDAIFFQLLSNDIIPSIINKNRGDVIGSTDNALENGEIRSYFLSPAALIEQIGKSFQTEEEVQRLISSIFDYEGLKGGIFSNDFKAAINSVINSDSVKWRQIAGYLVLKNTGDPTVQEKIKEFSIKIWEQEIVTKKQFVKGFGGNKDSIMSMTSLQCVGEKANVEAKVETLIDGSEGNVKKLVEEAKADLDKIAKIEAENNKNNKMDLDK